jgi:hypothetical protein
MTSKQKILKKIYRSKKFVYFCTFIVRIYGELFDFVENGVKTCTKGMQNPVISGNYDDILPIAVVNE